MSSRPPGPPADTPALKSKPRRVPSKGKNIPSSLDSTLFSNVSSKVVGHSGWSHRTVPDPNDVIEISSGSSDTPPPSLKGKNNIRPPNRRQENGTENNSRPKKTLRGVIEVLDSDQELEMQRSSHPTPGLSSRVLPSPKRTPSTSRMTTKGKSAVTTPPSVKSPVQDRGKTSRAVNLSPSPVKRVPDRSSLSTSLTLSRFSQTGMNPTSSPPSLLTERALGRLSAGHSQKMSGISHASEEGSISASVSDDEGVNMIDLQR